MNIGDKITVKLPFERKAMKVRYMGESDIKDCIRVAVAIGRVVIVHKDSVIKNV